MEVKLCIRKNDWYIHKEDDAAYNAEKEIALIKLSQSFDFAFSVGCKRLYYRTTEYKLIYPEANYNDAWNYLNSINGTILSIEDDFDTVMKDEGLNMALGNIRINRMNFTTKVLTNGKDCDPCKC